MFLSCFKKEEKGSILVEVALFMPILIGILLLSIETSRYILAHQKASRVTASLGDLLARTSTPQVQINDASQIVGQIMQPFTLGSNSVVIASAVTRPVSASSTVVWQYRGAGNTSFSSRIGELGSTPVFPENFTLQEGETIIVTEFFYVYQPWFRFKFWDDIEIYNDSFYKPRVQNLNIN